MAADPTSHVRDRHVEAGDPAMPGCEGCGGDWPCEVIRLCDEIDSLRDLSSRRCVEIDRLRAERDDARHHWTEQSKITATVIAEREAALAEVDRLTEQNRKLSAMLAGVSIIEDDAQPAVQATPTLETDDPYGHDDG